MHIHIFKGSYADLNFYQKLLKKYGLLEFNFWFFNSEVISCDQDNYSFTLKAFVY